MDKNSRDASRARGVADSFRAGMARSLGLRTAVYAAALVLVLLACVWLKDIVIPLLLAVIVAYVFNPVVSWFERRRVPRTLGIVVLIIAVIIGLAILVLLAAVTMAGDAQRLADAAASFQDKIAAGGTKVQTGIMRWVRESEYSDQIIKIIQENMNQLASYAGQMGSIVGTKAVDAAAGLGYGVTRFVAAIAKALLFAIVAFYLLKDFDQLQERAPQLIPRSRRDRVMQVGKKIEEHLRGFFRGQILVCLVLAAIYAVGLSLLGVPFALVIAVVGGFANMVPYLGLMLGVIPAAVLSLIVFGDIWHPAGAIGVFVFGQVMEGTVLTPRIVGRSAKLHPVVVILSILFFAQILGFVGLLVAVPMAAVIKVLVEEALQSYRHAASEKS